MGRRNSKMNADLVSLMLQRQDYIKKCGEQLPQTHYCFCSFINSSLQPRCWLSDVTGKRFIK